MNDFSPSFLRATVRTGLIIGVLDITAACVNAYIQRQVSPLAVCRYVATGVFGKEALTGGMDIAALGLLFHFIIATGWTFLFFISYKRVAILSTNKFLVGCSYGIFIWLMMSFVVVPLSNVPPVNRQLIPALIMIGIHMFVIGVPISLLANQYFTKENLKKSAL